MQINYLNFIYYGNEIAPADWKWCCHPYNYCNRLYYINGGDASYIDKDGAHKFLKGHIYFLPRSTNYRLVQDQNNRLDHLYFDFICIPIPCGTDVVALNTDNDEIISGFIQTLKQFVNKAPYYSKESAPYRRYITLTLTMLLEYFHTKYALPFLFDSTLQDSIIYMLEHFSEPISVNEIARRAGYNPKYFIRLFTDAMQITPYQFLRNMRINRALSLIKEGSSISQAAIAVGFQHASSLSNAIHARQQNAGRSEE